MVNERLVYKDLLLVDYRYLLTYGSPRRYYTQYSHQRYPTQW